MAHDEDKRLRETLSQNLTNRIRRLGYTKAEVAAAIGISASALSSYCNGARYPRAEQLEMLAKFLKCTVGELTDSEGEVGERGISNEAHRIASAFDQMDRHGRELVRIIVEAELKRIHRGEKDEGF